MGRKANKPEDVWKFIAKSGENECWLWTGNHSVAGYAIISIKHKTYRVSRIVCHLRDPESIPMRATANGSDRKIALHSCDNTGCCNPTHLSVGLPKQNTEDMIYKNRRAYMKGEQGGRAKLSNEDVKRIREAYRFGAYQKDLAQIYGVSVPTISTAISGKHYGCVLHV